MAMTAMTALLVQLNKNQTMFVLRTHPAFCDPARSSLIAQKLV
jgi:hypothetical protein